MNEKLDRQGLIRRARELAKLRGDEDWECVDECVYEAGHIACNDPECDCLDCVRVATFDTHERARLAATAPKMAELLEQMTDALEEAYEVINKQKEWRRSFIASLQPDNCDA